MATSSGSIAELVNFLADASVEKNVFNPYARHHAADFIQANAARRANLRLYLGQMASRRPRLLLLGEAPGYRGARLSGVPFTSEYILLNGLDGVAMFGPNSGYRPSKEVAHVLKEATATMVWEALAGLPALPLLWNAFPFHPHRSDRLNSNRPPTAGELATGAVFITEVLAIFNFPRVVAVGNRAALALERMGISAAKIRHPSHGGKAAFVAGLNSIASCA